MCEFVRVAIAVVMLVVVSVGVERLFLMVVAIVVGMVLVFAGVIIALVRVGGQGRGCPMPSLRKLIGRKSHARNGRHKDGRQPQEPLACEQTTKQTEQLF